MPDAGGCLQSPQSNVLPPHSTHALGHSRKCKAMEHLAKVLQSLCYGAMEVSDPEIMPEKIGLLLKHSERVI